MVPSAQATQLVLLGELVLPAGHSVVHAKAPSASLLTRPPGHALHMDSLEAPRAALNLPTAHGVQAASVLRPMVPLQRPLGQPDLCAPPEHAYLQVAILEVLHELSAVY